jgi:hypothetical protein
MPGDAGLCSGETIEQSVASGVAQTSVRVEAHIINVPAHPPESGGTCTSGAADMAASGIACSELLVIAGRYLGPL